MKKIKITPNKITMVRLFLIPLMVFFYLAEFIPYGNLIATIIFAIAALTDFVDGKLARKTGQVTDTGKFLDTLADKVLIMAGIVLIISDLTVMAPWGAIIAIIILAREFLVTGLRQIAVVKNVVIAADKWGKYKALFQDLAIPAFMLFGFFAEIGVSVTFAEIWFYMSYALIGIATLLTIISGVNYFVKNWKVFKAPEENGKEITKEEE